MLRNPLKSAGFEEAKESEPAVVMSNPAGWRCVMVPPPNSRAAIGVALRHAFAMDGPTRSPRLFTDLLERLR